MLLQILSLIVPELKSVAALKKYGVEIDAVVNGVVRLQSAVSDVQAGKLVSQEVGVLKIGADTIKYGVYAQKA